MAGELNVYQNCLCGSGKKLKFCCHAIVDEMLRIGEMQKHHQFQMALAALEALEKRNVKEAWSRAWVKTTKALVLCSLRGMEEARRIVEEVLEELPNHPLATTVNGMLSLTADGYPAAKRAVYNAFQAGIETGKFGFLLSRVAGMMATHLADNASIIGARQHLALALAFDPDNKDVAEHLQDLQGDATLPYFVRSQYVLSRCSGDESQREASEQATKLAGIGCFSDAAKAFGQIARQAPNQSWVWWNIALCHAWAGEDPLAVEAFKAAAANEADPEAAAECLVLSRSLQVPADAARVERLSQAYRVHSVGKLLTQLDQQPLYARGTIDAEEEDDDGEIRPAAWYKVLDRDPNSVPLEELTVDNVPLILGQITIFDANPQSGGETAARAIIGCMGRDKLEPLMRRFAEVAGAEVEADGEPVAIGYTRAEAVALMLPWHLPAALSLRRSENLQRARWEKIVYDLWMNGPQELLGGESPLQASKNPERGVALRAALIVLDSFCEQSGYALDVESVRERLGLLPAAPLELGPGENPWLFSIPKLRRLAFEKLSDEQLIAAWNRVGRVGHAGLAERAIRNLLARTSLATKIDSENMYMSMVNLSREQLRSEEALDWLTKGKQDAKARKASLEALLVWEFEELILRSLLADDAPGSDPQREEIAATLWNYYRPKLPNAAQLIAGMLNQMELPGPWNVGRGNMEGGNAGGGNTGESESLAAVGAGAGGIWTPEAQASGQPSKLWLPGQE